MRDAAVVLFLAGDVMTGRGVDQILPHPGEPGLREQFVDDARTYVELAEARYGAIQRPVDFAWPWGQALAILDQAAPDVRVINLETSVTRSADYDPAKGIHYRMHPQNVACLTALRPTACALANNHVLDFGVDGLTETLDTLRGAGLSPVGAGRDEQEAWRPVVAGAGPGRRLLIWSVAMPSSGTARSWAAAGERPGVALLPDTSPASVARLAERVRHHRRPGDLVLVSVHWGSNWGYEMPDDHVRFARRLVDTGVDVVHGHSSHHPRPVEVYRDRLVLYGCGDLIDDYEGISGYQEYRGELRLLYLATLDAASGRLRGLRMVPVRVRRMRLERASAPEAAWLGALMDRISRPFGTRFTSEHAGLVLR